MLTTEGQIAALVNLFHQGTRLVYEKGEFVIRPGGPPQGVYYILSGLVKAYDITKFGEENLLVIRKPGEILGLSWAVTGEDKHLIYSTLMRTELLQISRKQFIDFLHTNPSAALPLIDVLVDMYRLHSERIINLEYRTVRERLASFLLSMSERFGKQTPEGIMIDAPLRHQGHRQLHQRNARNNWPRTVGPRTPGSADQQAINYRAQRPRRTSKISRIIPFIANGLQFARYS